MTRAFGYLRVSQEKKGQVSPEIQRDAILEHCERKGWTITDWFEDLDWSATRYRPLEMPGLSEMVRRAEDGEADAVVFYRADRFVREHTGDFYIIRASLQRQGVEMAFAGREYDDSPEGDFMLGLDVLHARLESRRLGVRMRDMHRKLRRQGKQAGGAVPFGWRRVRDNEGQQRLLLDSEPAAIRRRMHELVWRGWSLRRVAFYLNEEGVPTPGGKRWLSSSVDKMLRKETQVGGRKVDGEIVVTGRIEPLLTREEFERTLAILATRKQRPERYSPRALRGPLVRCGTCGGPMYLMKSSRVFTYRCSNAMRKLCPQCTTIREAILVAEVEPRLLRYLKRLEPRGERHPPAQTDMAALFAQEAAATEALGRLASLFARKELAQDEFESARALERRRLDKARAAIDKARDSLRSEAHMLTQDQRLVLRGMTPELWGALTVDEQHDIYRAVVDRIVVNPRGQGQRVRIFFRR